jgi:hypothetical protein
MKHPIISHNFKLFKSTGKATAQILADRFKTTRGAIESYVDGRAKPGPDVLIRICNYYGLQAAQVLNQKLTEEELKGTGSIKTVTEVKLEAALREIALLKEQIRDKTKIIALLEKQR